MSGHEDLRHLPVRVLLLDTLTGATAVDGRCTLWGWTEGNWSCDCNRGGAFGLRPDNRGTCRGCRRFVVVAHDAPGYTLRDFNPGYPEKLLAEFCDGGHWPLTDEERAALVDRVMGVR